MSTQIKQGSDEYIAPEILFGRLYNGAVDIWGIGCLLYELFAGHRIFSNRADIQNYDAGRTPLPQLSYICPPVDIGPSQFAVRVLSTSRQYWALGDPRNQLQDFWMAFKAMPLTDARMVGVICAGGPERMREINTMLKCMLDCDPRKRPDIAVVAHHFRANHLRSMLENDDVHVPPFSSNCRHSESGLWRI